MLVNTVALVALAAAARGAIVTRLDAAVGRYRDELNGVHFSPLNHQLYFVYSQLVYDESFEQSLSPGLPDGLPQPSMGWVAPGPDPSETAAAGSGGTGTARWVNDSAAFNGNVSARLDGAGAALANRGLQLAGLAL